ncbi:hotdog fold domain-containing protein [Conexibacter arvalis]|uniref:Acyl-coenzyme A thioesterase PaaI-like protein n=1 Tax=Conexibacter arvalis TaxID=912552 RepID=A0A840IJ51_9ACTN|nr:hotdog fold domain-containing protein [Conexibacter arvalis]MBB4665117.1 acyl-coenzyme A thioesterase PaaI-like protein [Conexibacter arvalis]
MPDPLPVSRLLSAYRLLERVPLGRTLFSQGYRFAAPYFRTIPARVESVEPGVAVAEMRHAPWVRNHLGGVHAIALCNLAELTMGAAAEATVPRTHRWIPQAMEVEYRARAQGRMRCTARLDLPQPLGERQQVAVAITVTDRQGVEVLTGTIRIWVTERPRR